jgi:predicted O-methyltransferase YrrM
MSQLLDTYLKKLKQSGLERKIPNISEQNAEFIKDLIREKDPNHLLEIGTANGYSTLQFATVIWESSTITTIEYAWSAHNEAVEHFSNCKIKNIHALWGDAKKILPSLQNGYFDFLYIDAMKREYLDYLLLSLPKLTDDAIIVIDDVEKFRDKMENLFWFLDESGIKYTLEKTDADDSIMILYRSSFVWIDFLK